MWVVCGVGECACGVPVAVYHSNANGVDGWTMADVVVVLSGPKAGPGVIIEDGVRDSDWLIRLTYGPSARPARRHSESL